MGTLIMYILMSVLADNYALIIVPQTVDNSAWLTEYGFFSAFPMFPFAMAGGILVMFGDAMTERECCRT